MRYLKFYCLCFLLWLLWYHDIYLSLFIHFEFILVYGASWRSSFIFWHVPGQFSQHYLLKRLFLLHCMLLPPLSNIWIERISIIKMSILPKAVYGVNAIPIKTPIAYLTDLEQILQEFVCNQKNPNRLSNLEGGGFSSFSAILRKINKYEYHNTWYKTILQVHCNQNSLVLA